MYHACMQVIASNTQLHMIQESQTEGHPGRLLAPIPAFLSQSFFSKDLVGQKLKLDGLLAVNVVGSEAHRDRVCAALSGWVHGVATWRPMCVSVVHSRLILVN